jgi:hypothetical protein
MVSDLTQGRQDYRRYMNLHNDEEEALVCHLALFIKSSGRDHLLNLPF